MPESIPYYEPGRALSCFATAAITGKTFVKLSGVARPGPELNTDTTGGTIRVAPQGASVPARTCFGVAAYDAAINTMVKVWRGSGWIVPVTAAASLTAGTEVMSDATGKAVAVAGGAAPIGVLVDDVASGGDAQVALYG
jgi:Uncharacterized conserved protein (DUF2190)